MWHFVVGTAPRAVSWRKITQNIWNSEIFDLLLRKNSADFAHMTLPQAFTDDILPLLPTAERAAFIAALTDAEPQVSIRLNPRKAAHGLEGAVAMTAAVAAALGAELTPVPWCPEGWYLPQRPNFTLDPLLHAGVYYVQEASSMFLTHVVRSLTDAATPLAALDLCAAPGGKTTALLSALPPGSWLTANEIDRRRARILAENVTKWGDPNVTVTANAPRDFAGLTDAFDLIVADAPCSGEGMFRKDPAAIAEWSPRKVAECADTQRRILADVWPALRPGGLLVYSTCTYNVHEDEDIVAYLCDTLGAQPIEIPTRPEWHIHPPLTGTRPCCRFMPHVTRGEGLFVAAVRKDGAPRHADRRPIPASVAARARGLYVLQDGIARGVTKGRDYIPAHAEALAVTLPPDAYPRVGLDLETARRYLRREAIVLPQTHEDGTPVPRGHVIVTYAGHPLGFVKNLGNRSNNLYPQEWRIRFV